MALREDVKEEEEEEEGGLTFLFVREEWEMVVTAGDEAEESKNSVER